MLVALIGKTEQAKAGNWDIPFTDVEPWARPYVGYAYAHQLTSGLSATTYGGNQPITASQYLTFVLKALGYESGKDFQWNQAWILTDQLGITDGKYSAQSTTFLRGDVALVSWAALDAKENGKNNTLAQKMINEGIFTSSQTRHSKPATPPAEYAIPEHNPVSPYFSTLVSQPCSQQDCSVPQGQTKLTKNLQNVQQI